MSFDLDIEREAEGDSHVHDDRTTTFSKVDRREREGDDRRSDSQPLDGP